MEVPSRQNTHWTFSVIRYTLCSCFAVKPQEATGAGMLVCVFRLEQKDMTRDGT
jgi:hypothetical protein